MKKKTKGIIFMIVVVIALSLYLIISQLKLIEKFDIIQSIKEKIFDWLWTKLLTVWIEMV